MTSDTTSSRHHPRPNVHHPATARELAQILRVPREERNAFKRQLKALVADRRAAADPRQPLRPSRQDGPRRRPAPHQPRRVRLRRARACAEAGRARRTSTSPRANLTEAMHGDRVVARVERETRKGARRAHHPHPRAQPGDHRRPLRGRRRGARLRRAVRPARADRRARADRPVVVGRARRDGARRDHALADGHARSGRAASSKCSGTSTSRASTRRSSSASSTSRTRIRRRPSRKRGASAARSRSATSAARTDFRDRDDRHDRRRARARLRRCDHDRAAAERQLLAGRAHRRRLALREGGQRARRGAYERGTSVYFTERAVHMFPAELATGLCSLNPHVDRLVQSCLMEVDRRGNVVRYEMHDGVINSDARMTYTAVNAILTERDADDHRAVPRARADVRADARAVRDPARAAPAAGLDRLRPARSRGDPVGVRRRSRPSSPSERNVAHRLIEEFMLLANETVAAHLVEHDVPSLHRVHEPPDVKKVADFEAFITHARLQPCGQRPDAAGRSTSRS